MNMDKRTPIQGPRTILQLVLVDETGDSYYRMRWPGKQLAEQAPGWRVVNLDARAQERFIWAEHADLLVLFQSNDIDLLPIIEKRRKSGRKTLVEYSDNFYSPPPASPVYEPWSSPLIWQSYELIMNAGDALIVTGPGLKELFTLKTTKPIYILENHLPEKPKPFEELWSAHAEGLNCGWAGSLGHLSDLLALMPMMRELAEESPEIIFHLMGNESIPEMLRLSEDRCRFTNWGGMQEYYNFWRPVQLGFAAMIDSAYNRCRSDIKAVEMAGLAVLPVIPPALPYMNFIRETKAPTFSTARELKTIISNYLKQPEKLKADTHRCYQYVIDHRIGLQRVERLELYAEYISGDLSSFRWPFSPGYHEFEGRSKTEMRHAEVLRQAEGALQLNKRDYAARLLAKGISENPHSAELAIAELKNLLALKDPGFEQRLSDALTKFPLDLRFMMLKLISRNSEPDRADCWNELFAFLAKQPPSLASYFATDLVKLYIRQLKQFPSLLSTADQMLEYFSGSAELRFFLAHLYEKQGKDEDALKHFTWLLTAKKETSQNQDFLEGTTVSYLQTWYEALAARTAGLGLKRKPSYFWQKGSK